MRLPSQWIIDATPWQWALVILLPIAAAWWMYGRGSGTHKTATGGGMGIVGRITLALLRTLVLSILAVLLLEPLLRNIHLDQEDPVAVLLIDESASIGHMVDSTQAIQKLRQFPKALQQSLEKENVNLETFGFSGQFIPREIDSWDEVEWTGEQTNLEIALKEIEARFENQNLAGIILASDGLINRGARPEFSPHWLPTPVYTIGLGDTTIVRDLWIERVDHNRVAYLGNDFPAEVVIQSQGMENKGITIDLLYESKVIATQAWIPTSPKASKKINFNAPAKATGLQRYTVRCSVDIEETNTRNNTFPFYLDILESKRKVLIIANAPHPDISSVALALEEQDQTEVTITHMSNLTDASTLLGDIEDTDVVIAHNILGGFFGSMSWHRLFRVNRKPCWWILSDAPSQSALASIPDLGIRLEELGTLNQRHQIRKNPNFKLFEVSKSIEIVSAQWPPMQGPFCSIQWSSSWNPLFYKQLGSLETQEACWAVRDVPSEPRDAVIVGSGLWGWRMRNYVQNENHQNFNEIIQNLVQFLGSERKKERLSVAAPKIIEVDQRFELTAEVYDAALMPMSGLTIDLLLQSEDGKEFPLIFSERNQRYSANAGRLSKGSYTWTASCQLDRESFQETGVVIVQGYHAEHSNKPANHDLLLRIAESKGGVHCGILNDQSPDQIAAAMQEKGVPATILHEQVKLNELISWDYILFGLMVMLSIEWIARRRSFGY